MHLPTNQQIREAAMKQQAFGSNCAPEDFLRTENVFTVSKPNENAHKYFHLPVILDIVSFGTNAVVSGDVEIIEEIKPVVNGTSFYRLFETPKMYALNEVLSKKNAKICFMADYFLPDVEKVFSSEVEKNLAPRILVTIKVLEPSGKCGGKTDAEMPDSYTECFENLYRPEWSNALCDVHRERNVLALGAYDGEKLVALAGASADAEDFWQIGVDCLPEYRRNGIASAITNRIAREIFLRGKIPFYCCAWSNILSVKNALRAGFVPGWVQVTAKPNEMVDGMAGVVHG